MSHTCVQQTKFAVSISELIHKQRRAPTLGELRGLFELSLIGCDARPIEFGFTELATAFRDVVASYLSRGHMTGISTYVVQFAATVSERLEKVRSQL